MDLLKFRVIKLLIVKWSSLITKEIWQFYEFYISCKYIIDKEGSIDSLKTGSLLYSNIYVYKRTSSIRNQNLFKMTI